MNLDDLMRETQEARAALGVVTPLGGPSRPPQPDKRVVLESVLSSGVLQVQVDTTLPGVNLPDDLLGQLLVVLNFSYKYAGQDLQLSDEEIQATLSFNGNSHHVRVPLKAILAARSLVTGQGAEFQVFTGETYQEDPKEPA